MPTPEDAETIEGSATTGSYYGGGCTLCGIPGFATSIEAVDHSRSEAHKAKGAERRPKVGDTRQSSQPVAPRSRPVPPRPPRGVKEGKPWDLFITGTDLLNLGSYEFDGTVDLVKEAHYLVGSLIEAEMVKTGVDPVFTFDHVSAVAEVLLAAADQAQASIRGSADRMDPSHRRAREAVKAVVKTYPLQSIDADSLEAWKQQLADAAASFLGIAFELLRRNEGLEFPHGD